MWAQSNDQGIGDGEVQYISIENDGNKSQNNTECDIHSQGWTETSLGKSNKRNQYQQNINHPQWCNVSQLLSEQQNYTFKQANESNENKIRDKRRKNVNRSYEDVRDNEYWFSENRENEDKICTTCNCIMSQSSVDTPSEYMPSFIISVENNFEDDSRRSQRSRRSEHNTSDRQQNRYSQQLAAPSPDTSYNYKLDDYDESANMCERQQQEQDLEWQDQYQNNCRKKHSVRRLSGLGDVPYVNKNQMEYYEIPFPDLSLKKEDRLSPKCEDEWQQQDQHQNNCRKKQSARRLSGLGDVPYVDKNQMENYEMTFPDTSLTIEDKLSQKLEEQWQPQDQYQNNYRNKKLGRRLPGLSNFNVPFVDKNQTQNYEMPFPDGTQLIEDRLSPICEDEWQQQEDQRQSSCRNIPSVRRVSGTFDGPRTAKDRKKNYEAASTDVAPKKENKLSPTWEDQWQQKEDQVKDYRRIESKLATVEHERLHLLQRIERYQQAWLTETRCKLDNLQRQMNVRWQKEHEEEQPQHESDCEQYESPLPHVYEQYESRPPQPKCQKNRRSKRKPSTAPSRLTCDPVQSQWRGQPPSSSSLTDFGANADGCYGEQRENLATKSCAPPPPPPDGYVDRKSDDAIRTASASTNRASRAPGVDASKAVPSSAKFECSCTPEQLPADGPPIKCNFSASERSRSGMDCNNAAAAHVSSPDTIEFYEYYCSTANGAPPPAPRLELLRTKCGNCGAGRRWT